MEKVLKQILDKLNSLEVKVDELYSRRDKIDESHEWLSAMHHANQVQKAELDQLSHKVAKIEGALTGVANSLEPLKKAQ